MLARILVPLDGSPLAERALPYAEALARSTLARLVLGQVARERGAAGRPATLSPAAATGDAERYLGATAAALRARGIAAETAVRHEEAAEAIIEEADRRRVDLIIMTTHGR